MRIAILTPQQAADCTHAGWCAARAGQWAGDCPHGFGSAERRAWLDGFRTFLSARGDSRSGPDGPEPAAPACAPSARAASRSPRADKGELTPGQPSSAFPLLSGQHELASAGASKDSDLAAIADLIGAFA